jgi:anti-sigma regulatory factor (Ser/Thr protein kinase)
VDGQEPEEVIEVVQDAPVVELTTDGQAVAAESSGVEIVPLSELDPSSSAVAPEITEMLATPSQTVIVDTAACDLPTAADETAGSPPAIEQSLRRTPPVAAGDSHSSGGVAGGGRVTCSATFAAVASSVAAARTLAAQALADIPADALDAVRLMISELASNAVEHVLTDFHVVVHRTPREVRVEVSDNGAGSPTLRSPGPDAHRGRGLQIVDMLSSQWGVEQQSDSTKTVWFTLKLAAERPGG